MNVIWLASYPKSGNTWLSTFLYHYFFGTPKASGDIHKGIPDIHDLLEQGRRLNEENPNTVMCKTHFLYSAQHPHIGNTAGFIYLLRHPKDVLLSGLNFFRLSSAGSEVNEAELAQSFIQHMGMEVWLNYGGWAEHVGSWLAASRVRPHLFLRYEEMRQSPLPYFRKVIEFINNGEVDEEKLAQAVETTSFANMRKMEEQEKTQGIANTIFSVSDTAAQKGLHFVNKGAIGQNLKHISEELDQQFDARFAQVLSLLGYSS